MKSGGSLSIWFFIGLSLAVDGALIFAAGLYAIASPPQNRVVLYDVHADIWWGALLLILGLVYCFRFSPSRVRNASHS